MLFGWESLKFGIGLVCLHLQAKRAEHAWNGTPLVQYFEPESEILRLK
jgi:hypothetical protein